MHYSNLTREIELLILDFFGGNTEKARLWFETPNPLFGGFRPDTMIRMGRADKLLGIVQHQLSENKPLGCD